MLKRRTLLRAVGGVGLAAARIGAPAQSGGARQRVVIVGAGWAGLAAAQALRRDAPTLELTVIDRDPVFRALPLSNAWLVGATPERLARFALADLAQRHGWRFVAAPVHAIDRAQRIVQTAELRFVYDWLLVASGAAADYGAWCDGNTAAAQRMQALYPGGVAAGELDTLKRGLDAFGAAGGGTLVMTVPPAPYRCPPAPYERAALIGWWIRSRALKARLIVIDAGGGMPRFTRLFAERYRAQIEHRPHSTVRTVDPQARTLTTDDGVQRFDHAMLWPPMHAGALAEQAGLLGRDASGHASRWAAVDPATLRSPHDERIYVAGDGLDAVSPLFGAYPKTAQIAAELGAAAAAHLVAASRGEPPARAALPSSQCHVWLDAEPREQLQLDASFRLRGDGVIAQSVRQLDNPQPRDEDLAWARSLMAQRLGLLV